jgi:carbamoyl-phosphate synthase large subunit
VDGKLQIIECNPRFGGASTTSIAVGLDSLYWSLTETLNDNEFPVFHRIPGEARQIRMSVDRVIYGSDF